MSRPRDARSSRLLPDDEDVTSDPELREAPIHVLLERALARARKRQLERLALRMARAAERRRGARVQKPLRDLEAETPAMRDGLRRGLQPADRPPAALCAVFQKESRTRTDVEQTASTGVQHPLERVVPLGIHEIQPLA